MPVVSGTMVSKSKRLKRVSSALLASDPLEGALHGGSGDSVSPTVSTDVAGVYSGTSVPTNSSQTGLKLERSSAPGSSTWQNYPDKQRPSRSPTQKQDLTHDYKGLLAWIICFSTYAAIVSRKHLGKIQQLLAY